MADNILRLTVNSEDYDAKLKKAAEGIRHLADVAHRGDGDLTGLEKSTLDYIKAVGDMETKSRTAAGSVRELESTFKELTVIYNQLSETEKADEGGKALAASLEKLKQRAIDARTGLNEASQALQENQQSAQNSTFSIDGLSSAFGINLKSLTLWGGALAAAKGALEVFDGVMQSTEGTSDALASAQEQLSSAVNGFFRSLNDGSFSSFLSGLDDIIQRAKEAYDAVDLLSSFSVRFEPANMADMREIDKLMKESRALMAKGDKEGAAKKTGEAQEVANRVKENITLKGNLEYDAGIKTLRELLGESGKYFTDGQIEWMSDPANFFDIKEKADAYDEAKRELENAAESLKNIGRSQNSEMIKKADTRYQKAREKFESMSEYSRNASIYMNTRDTAGTEQGDKFIKATQQIYGKRMAQYAIDDVQARIDRTEAIATKPTKPTGGTKVTPQEQAQKAVEAALLSYNQSIEKAKMSLDNGTATEADTKKKLLSAEEQLWTAYGKAYAIYSDPAYKTAQDESAKKIKELGGEVVNAVEAQKKQEQATRELEAAQKKLADAQRELATARNSGKLSDIYSAEKKVATAQGEVTRLESGQPLAIPEEKTVTIKANTENITAQIAHLKEQMGSLEIGSIAFDKTQESLVDMTTLQSLINTQLKAGLKIDQTVTSDLMQQILGGENIDDKAWQALVDEINQKLAELELPPIKLNFQTGDVAKDAKAAAKEWQAAGSAIQSVGSAMTQIEDPAAKVLGTVAQAIANVALAASQAIAARDTTASGWAWIGAAAAITGTMISTIAAIKSATAGSYAEGGIIPGNKYSGDEQLAWVNAGELILNRSQANNIANQLQGGTLGNLHLSATVSGEQIRLVLNNNGKRTGRGEFLTTRFS